MNFKSALTIDFNREQPIGCMSESGKNSAYQVLVLYTALNDDSGDYSRLMVTQEPELWVKLQAGEELSKPLFLVNWDFCIFRNKLFNTRFNPQEDVILKRSQGLVEKSQRIVEDNKFHEFTTRRMLMSVAYAAGKGGVK